MLSSFANFIVAGKRSDRFHRLISYCGEARAVTKDAQRGAGQPVGQGHGGLVPWHAGDSLLEPRAKAEALPTVGSHHDHLGGLHEEHAQVSASPLGGPSHDRVAIRAELSGRQPNPGREVAAPVEGLALSDRRDHGPRNHEPDARDRHDVRAVLLCATDLLGLLRHRRDPVVEPQRARSECFACEESSPRDVVRGSPRMSLLEPAVPA